VQRSTGRDGRYFELDGVPRALSDRWSQRASDIDRAAREFRDGYGRDPKGAELDRLVTATRGTKTALDADKVDLAWKALAEEHGLNQQRAESLFAGRIQTPRVDEQELKHDVLERLTRERATASDNELRAIAYERSAGAVHPDRAERLLGDLERSGELVRLDNGTWTSRQLRERERQTVETVKNRASERAAPVDERSLDVAREQVEREIGHPLTAEQRQAAATITGAGGVSVLTGRAGTGKGVVLRTARRPGARTATASSARRSPARRPSAWRPTLAWRRLRPPTN
jgi:hypothetical protein